MARSLQQRGAVRQSGDRLESSRAHTSQSGQGAGVRILPCTIARIDIGVTEIYYAVHVYGGEPAAPTGEFLQGVKAWGAEGLVIGDFVTVSDAPGSAPTIISGAGGATAGWNFVWNEGE